MTFIIAFLSSFILAVFLTILVKKVALKLDIVDRPGLSRKIHPHSIPLMGGIAVFLSFVFTLIYFSLFTDLLIKDFISPKYIIGICLAALVIILGGVLDDKYNLKPKQQLFFSILAALIIIIFGIGISHVRNPFGGTIRFDQINIYLFSWQGIPYKITLLADFFTFIWLMGMMYTTKLLDGLDGLVSGVTVIASLIIFGIAINSSVHQPNTGLIALILAGAFSGFLIFNFNPAKIFLGEGGALFAGLMLGVLAIISGSKVATTLLIMGIPVLDVAWIILRRIKEGKNPFKTADKKHLHFRLLDAGFTQRQAVIFFYCLTALFGSAALFLQSFGKLIALIILFLVMVILATTLVVIYKRRNYENNQPNQ